MPRLARNRRIAGSCKRFGDVFGQSGRVPQRPMTRGCRSSRMLAVDALDFLVPVSGPQCPQNKVGAITGWKEGEPINSAMFAEPVPFVHMVRMRVLGNYNFIVGMAAPVISAEAVSGSGECFVLNEIRNSSTSAPARPAGSDGSPIAWTSPGPRCRWERPTAETPPCYPTERRSSGGSPR